MTVSVSLQEGQLAVGESVTVYVSTRDGTATSPADYIGLSNQPVTFDASTHTHTVKIPIIDDDDPEEYFTVKLTASHGPEKRQSTITITTDVATVVIMTSVIVDEGIATGLKVGVPILCVFIGIAIIIAVICYCAKRQKKEMVEDHLC